LLVQAVQSANNSLSGTYLLGGTASAAAPFQVTRDSNGTITGVAYNGSNATASIPLSESATVSPYTDASTNAGVADFLNHLVSLRDALNRNDSSAVATVSRAASRSTRINCRTAPPTWESSFPTTGTPT
jgi:flagellar hook-associated protein 3 FlgL